MKYFEKMQLEKIGMKVIFTFPLLHETYHYDTEAWVCEDSGGYRHIYTTKKGVVARTSTKEIQKKLDTYLEVSRMTQEAINKTLGAEPETFQEKEND